MKTKISVLSIFLALFMASCFNFGGGEATLIINLGASRANAVWPPDSQMLNDMGYKVKLSGGLESRSFKARGGDIIKAAVTAGLYNIKVDAYYNGEHYATGSNTVNVKAGQDNLVTIQMHEAGDVDPDDPGDPDDPDDPGDVTYTVIFDFNKS